MRSIIFTNLLIVLFVGCTNGQTNNNSGVPLQNKTADTTELSYKNAHPNAKALMRDDFYWSPIEETAPFGSDDGFDAAYGFKQWRIRNKTVSPVIYLNELIRGWRYPFFDYNEMDTTKIREYILSQNNPDENTIKQQIERMKDALKQHPDTSMNKLDDKQIRDIVISTSKEMGGVYLLAQDNAIIGIGFAQFVLEGHVNSDIKALTVIAIKRQLLPILINLFDDKYRDRRKEQLTKMLEVISKAN